MEWPHRDSGKPTWSLKKNRRAALRQRVGSLHFERILRRQNEISASILYVRRPTVTRLSCIASRSALCVFGVARFTSSAQDDVAKMGGAPELEKRR